METESGKYQSGLSGQGGANYSSAAWRAGDLERQRQQSLTNKPDTDKNDIYGFPILIFMGLFTWAAVEVNSYFGITDGKTVGIGACVVSYIIGIFIRDFLLAAFNIALMLALVAGVGAAGYHYITKDNKATNVSTKSEVNNIETQTGSNNLAFKTREEAVALAKKIIADDMVKLKKLNANSVPKIERDERSVKDR